MQSTRQRERSLQRWVSLGAAMQSTRQRESSLQRWVSLGTAIHDSERARCSDGYRWGQQQQRSESLQRSKSLDYFKDLKNGWGQMLMQDVGERTTTLTHAHACSDPNRWGKSNTHFFAKLLSSTSLRSPLLYAICTHTAGGVENSKSKQLASTFNAEQQVKGREL